MVFLGLVLLAGLAAQDVVEAGAELGGQATGDGQDKDDPQNDDQPKAELVEILRAVVGRALAGVGHLIVHRHDPVGSQD